VDGDGIPFRTIPGTHPTKGDYFTRGTSRDEYARYTEKGDAYVRNVDRLTKKWETSKELVPAPEFYQNKQNSKIGMVFFGTTTYAALEAMDRLKENNIVIDSMRLKGFPFSKSTADFIHSHDMLFVIEQNRDGQMRSLIMNELDVNPSKLISILNYDGMPIKADFIYDSIQKQLEPTTV
jgi:2-oxoglutarate ferredoxin oxidoreductase subunit alpha